MYCVYEHWRPDTGTCFYVGKGVCRRPKQMYNRNQWHKNIVKKLKDADLCIEIKIIAEGLSNEEAIALEIARIAFYGRENLTNLTDGGDSGGHTVTPETRAKIAATLRGRPRPPEVVSKIAASSKGVPRPTLRGKAFSAEHKARISAGKRGYSCPDWVRAKISSTKKATFALRRAAQSLNNM